MLERLSMLTRGMKRNMSTGPSFHCLATVYCVHLLFFGHDAIFQSVQSFPLVFLRSNQFLGRRVRSQHPLSTSSKSSPPIWSTQKGHDDDEDETIERTSFDQAGASLIEEEDVKRMENMGDFDSNPNVRA